MPGKYKIAIGLGGGLAAFLLLISFFYFNRDDFQKRLAQEEPIGILVGVRDESRDRLPILGQMVIFPKQKRLLFFFVNTDAYYDIEDEAILQQSPRSADRFPSMTQVPNSYRILVNKKSAIRLVDLIGGMALFLEEPAVFDEQNFLYLQGMRFFAGEDFVEYSLARHTTQPDRAYLNGVERLHRFESMLLNLLWHKEQIRRELQNDALKNIAFSFLDTDLSKEEFLSLAEFASAEDTFFSVLELPLGIAKKERKPVLLVKPKSAKVLFQTYREDAKAGRLQADNFPIEVLNGTDTAGLARRVKQYMQDRGLQVLDADNFGFKPVPKSIIVERSGDTWKARHLQKMTSLKAGRVVFRRMPMDVDASFIIGDDFKIRQLQQK